MLPARNLLPISPLPESHQDRHPEPRSAAMSGGVSDLIARVQRKHLLLDTRDGPLCGACGEVFPCDPVRVAAALNHFLREQARPSTTSEILDDLRDQVETVATVIDRLEEKHRDLIASDPFRWILHE